VTTTAPRTLVRRAGRSAGPALGRRRPPRPSWAALALAAAAYLPMLYTRPGKVGADTKAYLYIDPWTMLRRAVSMWDPHVSTGGVTHQNIGYLLPQGLYYAVASSAGLPVWVAQRLWSGSVLFAAGAGVLFLLRSFRWPDRYAFVAAFAYMLSPYLLEYEARMSVILLPWCGLGWMVGIAVRGLREARPGRPGWGWAGWRWPAAFALTVTLVGSINASSLIFVLLAPLLWVPFAVWGTGETTLRAAGGLVARTAVLLLAANVWWMSGLLTQGRYGLDVLAYTETIQTVASSSQASEVLRGLGNWYFYGRDSVGPWIGPAQDYTQVLLLILISFTVPLLALAAAAVVRWTHRGYFVTLVVVGTTIAVGAYPYHDPSPFGALLKAFGTGSTVGLALRSTPRAVPLVALGFAVLLAGGIAAWAEAVAERRAGHGGPVAGSPGRARRLGPAWLPAAAGAGVVVLVALNMLPLWQGRLVDAGLDRPENLPAYETALGRALTAEGTSTRTLELPGADFSHYRWGTTLDPVTTGLTDRSVISRQLVPDGEPASADLIRALDRRLQEGVFEGSSLADVARLLGVGDVELRSDLQYERFRTPRPRTTWPMFTAPRPAGLTAPRTFGPPIAETPAIPYTDEITLGTPANAPDPPAIALFGVTDPNPIVRAETTTAPLLVSGNGEGLVDASAAGLLAGPVAQHRTVLYSAAMAGHPDQLTGALNDGAVLLLTDSNRLRAERWSSLRENYGYVQQVGVAPLVADPNDNPLPVFPGAGDDTKTVAQMAGADPPVVSVRATDYGNSVAYAPADQPLGAIDGDPATAWRVGAFANPVGARWQVNLRTAATTDQVTLTQPITGSRNRWITRATLRFDGGSPVTVDLGDASRTAAGQVLRFPARTFTTLDITIDATNAGVRPQYNGLSAVGLAEVTIGSPAAGAPKADEELRLPTDLLTSAGASSLDHQLILQLTRDRANPAEPFKSDTELSMARVFTLPTARTFALTGTARISALAPDQLVDAVTGRPAGPVTATSSGRLPGDLTARAASAFDGNPATFWSPGTGDQVGGWVQATSAKPLTFSSLDLTVVADGRHSVPTRLGLVVDGKKVRELTVPPLADTERENGTWTVRLPFPAVHGHTVRLVVDGVRAVTTKDSISLLPTELPVALADVTIPGLRVAPEPATVPSACRRNLLTVDGHPVGVRLSGRTTTANAGGGLTVTLCGPPLNLAKGSHVLRTAPGAPTGIDLDRLILASDPGGRPSAITPAGTVAEAAATSHAVATTAAATPAVRVVKSGDTSYTLSVSGATPGSPFWLVLGESLSKGWQAKIGSTSLGTPRLVDGYANGWQVTPTASAFTVSVVWTPQRVVWAALVVSGVAIPVCVLLILFARPRRRAGSMAGSAAEGRLADFTADVVPGPDLPRLEAVPRHRPGASPRAAVAVAVGVGLLGAVLTRPWLGGVAAVLTLAAMLAPAWRIVLRVGSVVCLAISAMYVIEVQARYHLPASGDWVSAFHRVDGVSYLSVILLVADVIVASALRRAHPTPPDAPPQKQPDPPPHEPALPEPR
jgi:arabinofuranan 3-O-arabinosyltransferase